MTAATGGAGAAGMSSGGAGAAGTGTGGMGAGVPATAAMGIVTFTNLGPAVEISVAVTGCIHGKSYPIHIHSGTSCADEMSQSGHWDPPRGEMIPNVECMNAVGTAVYQRESSDAKPWTVGPPEESNVIGHVVVLHDPDMPMKRIACGQIKAQ
jgi:hypothetical protein